MKKTFAYFILLISIASAQRAVPSFIRGASGGNGPGGGWGVAQVMPSPIPQPAVIGAPFSGEESQRQIQVLPDGTRITREQQGAKVFRDSEGRTRVERPLFQIPSPAARFPGAAPANPVTIVEINDPAGGVYYLLDSVKKVAYRMKYQPVAPATRQQTAPARPASPPEGATSTPPGRPRTTTEDLGIRSINGVQAEGRRRTTTFPEGYMGNDRPLTDVTEDWIAVQLQLTVMSTTKSSRSGESVYELANVSLASPSPILFSPPPEYTIQDQQGPFTAEFGQRPSGANVPMNSISVQVPIPPGAAKQ